MVVIPQHLYADFLAGWACAYVTTSLVLPPQRNRWIDKILKRFGFVADKRKVTLQVSNTVLERVHGDMIERESLIVRGTYIPVIWHNYSAETS